MRKIIITILFILCLACPALGCIGARSTGMGWAQVAIVDDATMAYWNPSKLANNESLGFVFGNEGYERYYEAVIYRNFGLMHHIKNNRLEEYFFLSYGIKISNIFSLGIGIGQYNKTILVPYYDDKIDRSLMLSLSAGFDFQRLQLGLLVQDVNLRPSVAYKTDSLIICLEGYDILNYYDFRHYRAGLEYKLFFIKLRSGIHTYPGCSLVKSFGIGIEPIKNVSIDYAYNGKYSDLFSPQEMHVISCGIKI
jgi:hypothetical protein